MVAKAKANKAVCEGKLLNEALKFGKYSTLSVSNMLLEWYYSICVE